MLEAAHELRHVAQNPVLRFEPILQFAFEVGHEPSGFSRSLRFEVVEELVGQVCVLSQHVVQVAQPFNPQPFLFRDVCVHLVALRFNFLVDLELVRNSDFLFLHQSVRDALQLGPHRSQLVGMVLSAVLLLLNQSRFKFIPVDIIPV